MIIEQIYCFNQADNFYRRLLLPFPLSFYRCLFSFRRLEEFVTRYFSRMFHSILKNLLRINTEGIRIILIHINFILAIERSLQKQLPRSVKSIIIHRRTMFEQVGLFFTQPTGSLLQSGQH